MDAYSAHAEKHTLSPPEDPVDFPAPSHAALESWDSAEYEATWLDDGRPPAAAAASATQTLARSVWHQLCPLPPPPHPAPVLSCH